MTTFIKIKKTFYWILWNCVFGLAPFLIIYLVNRVSSTPIELDSFIKDGTIMFFCGALLGDASICIIQKDGVSKTLNNFALLSSIALLVIISLLYLIHYLKPDTIPIVILIEWLRFFIISSFIISFFLKFKYFNKLSH
jgi:hypothetical protein